MIDRYMNKWLHLLLVIMCMRVDGTYPRKGAMCAGSRGGRLCLQCRHNRVTFRVPPVDIQYQLVFINFSR